MLLLKNPESFYALSLFDSEKRQGQSFKHSSPAGLRLQQLSSLPLRVNPEQCAHFISENRQGQSFKHSYLRLNQHTNGWFTGTFLFVHSEDGPVSFYGYDAPSNKSFYAIFPDLEIEKEDGKWESIGLGYCATGAQQFNIEPKEIYHFTIDLYGFDMVKTGTTGRVKLYGGDSEFLSSAFDLQTIREILKLREYYTEQEP